MRHTINTHPISFKIYYNTPYYHIARQCQKAKGGLVTASANTGKKHKPWHDSKKLTRDAKAN